MKAANKIKTYILSAINFEAVDGKEFNTEEEKITELMSRFKSEYWYPANQQRYGTVTKGIASWLQGLPSDMSIAFYYNEIESLLIEWGYLKEDSREAKVQRELENYWLYLAGSLVAIAKSHNVA